MPRFMPQELFDGLAITLLMSESAVHSELMLRKFDELIKDYTTKPYPDEDYALVKQDLRIAANHIFDLAKKALDAVRNDYSDEAQRLGDRVLMLFFLKELDKAMRATAFKERTLLRRMFGGTLFNFERHQLVDRVDASQINALRAMIHVIMLRPVI